MEWFLYWSCWTSVLPLIQLIIASFYRDLVMWLGLKAQCSAGSLAYLSDILLSFDQSFSLSMFLPREVVDYIMMSWYRFSLYFLCKDCWMTVISKNHIVLSILFLYIFFIFYQLQFQVLKPWLFSPSAFWGFSISILKPPSAGCAMLWCKQCQFLAHSIHSKEYLPASDTHLLFSCLPRGLCTWHLTLTLCNNLHTCLVMS